MQPKLKIALSIFTFVALVLTGLAAAEQLPTTHTKSDTPLLSPSMISLSPKVVGKKGAKQHALPSSIAPEPQDTFLKDFPTMVE